MPNDLTKKEKIGSIIGLAIIILAFCFMFKWIFGYSLVGNWKVIYVGTSLTPLPTEQYTISFDGEYYKEYIDGKLNSYGSYRKWFKRKYGLFQREITFFVNNGKTLFGNNIKNNGIVTVYSKRDSSRINLLFNGMDYGPDEMRVGDLVTPVDDSYEIEIVLERIP